MSSSSRHSRSQRKAPAVFDDNELQSVAEHDERPGSFFIPGITARARCLSDGRVGEVLPMDDDSSGTNSSSSGNNSDPFARSLSFRRRRLTRMGSERTDARFQKMMEELRADRQAADEARKKAIRVKKRFEKQQGHHVPAKHYKSVLTELEKYGSAA